MQPQHPDRELSAICAGSREAHPGESDVGCDHLYAVVQLEHHSANRCTGGCSYDAHHSRRTIGHSDSYCADAVRIVEHANCAFLRWNSQRAELYFLSGDDYPGIRRGDFPSDNFRPSEPDNKSCRTAPETAADSTKLAAAHRIRGLCFRRQLAA